MKGKTEEGVYSHADIQQHFYWIDLKIIGRKDPESFINLFCSNYKKYEASKKTDQDPAF
ncbi:hypothetical protein JXL19_08535 [bacterium]|nr:hypothetical protein [bacterium]